MDGGQVEVKKLTGGPRFCRTCKGAFSLQRHSRALLTGGGTKRTSRQGLIIVGSASGVCSRWTIIVSPLLRTTRSFGSRLSLAGPWVDNW